MSDMPVDEIRGTLRLDDLDGATVADQIARVADII